MVFNMRNRYINTGHLRTVVPSCDRGLNTCAWANVPGNGRPWDIRLRALMWSVSIKFAFISALSCIYVPLNETIGKDLKSLRPPRTTIYCKNIMTRTNHRHVKPCMYHPRFYPSGIKVTSHEHRMSILPYQIGSNAIVCFTFGPGAIYGSYVA